MGSGGHAPGRPRISYLDALAAHAGQTPGAVALRDADSTLTWSQAWHAIGTVSRWLREQGVRRGDRVAIALPGGAANLVVILGAMASGAVAAPVNILLSPVERDDYLARIDPAVVLTGAEYQAGGQRTAGAAVRRGIVIDPGPYRGQESWPVGDSPAPRSDWANGGDGDGDGPDLAASDPLAPCLMFGTGGTTGTPKAAMWSDQALWLYAASCSAAMEVRRTDVELFFSPMFHIALVTGPFGTLFGGGGVHLLPKFDPETVAELLGHGEITRFFGAPTALARLIGSPAFDPARMGSVRRVLFGSTRSEPDLPGRLARAFPRAEFITGYGATEYGAVIRLRSWEDDGAGDHGVGKAVPGVTVLVVGPDGEVLPDGTVGELVIRAPWQMLGYWGADAGPSAFLHGGIRSGDLGERLPNGDVHLRGRSKDVVITGGENVFPVEVEDVLSAHPAVAEAAVVGVLDPQWGEKVVAAVVLKPGAPAPEARSLTAYLRDRLAGYKVPKELHFMAALPLTTTLKVDKRALRQRLGGG